MLTDIFIFLISSPDDLSITVGVYNEHEFGNLIVNVSFKIWNVVDIEQTKVACISKAKKYRNVFFCFKFFKVSINMIDIVHRTLF